MAEPTTLSVHRCRFVDFTPSAITALALPPLPLPSPQGKHPAPRKEHLPFGTLAVGHANGNIDICEWAPGQLQSSQAWVTRQTLSAPHPSKVDALVFAIRYPERINSDDVPKISDLRLFSSGGGSELLEWDIQSGSIRRSISSQGGSIWCMALNPASSILALGCEDGTVRLISLVHDSLTHLRRFDKVKCRILSIAWGPPSPRDTPHQTSHTDDDESSDDEENDWTDTWLVTGGSDSSLRKWDVSTGRAVDRMMVDRIRGERTLVWTVGALGDGTIISGDSMGNVKFWDSKTCTQTQSFQSHGADVLCLICGPDGKSIYTSGVDQKVTQFSHIAQTSPTGRGLNKWVQSASRRLHAHDVRALAIWPPYAILPSSHRRRYPIDVAPILASGGLDMMVILTPAATASSTIVKVINPLNTSAHATFEDAYHRKLAYVTGPSSAPALCISRGARLLCCMREHGLTIWKILPKDASFDDVEAIVSPDKGGWEKLLDMDLNVNTSLTACRLSDDGRWLAVSDLYESKLFSLKPDSNGGLSPSRVRNFADIIKGGNSNITSTGSLAFAFSPDSSKLAVSLALSGYVLVIDLSEASGHPTVLRCFDHHRRRNDLIQSRVVRGLSASTDVDMAESNPDSDSESVPEAPQSHSDSKIVSKVLRMTISSDGQWLATSDDLCRTHVFNLDSIQHHCVLPSSPLPAQALIFDSRQPNLLIMAYPNNTMQIYDVEKKQTPTWAKELCNTLPKRFTHAHDPVVGMALNPPEGTSPTDMVVDGPPSDHYILLWGSTWICKLQMERKTGAKTSKKRRRDKQANGLSNDPTNDVDMDSPETQQPRHSKMITHYRPILFTDFISPGELVVVERPLVDVLASLPPAYFKPKYGAS